MLRSMTAYGRGEETSALGRFVVEMNSVNGRHLDIKVSLPRELQRFEGDIRKYIASFVKRGSVSVYISAYYDAESPRAVVPNMPLIRQLRDAWKIISKELHSEKPGIDPQLIANEQGIFLYDVTIADEDVYRHALIAAVERALKRFISMKDVEGATLHDDIAERVEILEATIDDIQDHSGGATDRFRDKLMARIEEISSGVIDNEERILREVAIYAERLDIAEEIVRFKSSMMQMKGILAGNASSVGKTLEFILQELNREMNTIASKSSDAEIARLVVIGKTELERIREQIQNVE